MNAGRQPLESAHKSLPIVQGTEHLGFRCSGCGECCRALRVAVTHRDVRRLMRETREPASAIVDWLSTDEVDMTNEPSSFVELRSGRRLMVLAQRDGACRWLDEHQRCSVYDARPLDCQLFPFSLERDSGDLDGVRLTLLELERCEFHRDGHNDATALVERDARRWKELAEYQELVARWNRAARHRRRFGRGAPTTDEFITYCLAAPESPETESLSLLR